jgi:PGF-CTERM protein
MLSEDEFEFVVGNGACTEGVYSETVEEPFEDGGGTMVENTPGFGILLSMIALVGAFLITSKKK